MPCVFELWGWSTILSAIMNTTNTNLHTAIFVRIYLTIKFNVCEYSTVIYTCIAVGDFMLTVKKVSRQHRAGGGGHQKQGSSDTARPFMSYFAVETLCGRYAATTCSVHTVLYTHRALCAPWSIRTMLYMHHDLYAPCSICTMLYTHHALYTPCSIRTKLYTHHPLYAPCSIRTMLYAHCALYAPYSICTMLYTHHALYTPCSILGYFRSPVYCFL